MNKIEQNGRYVYPMEAKLSYYPIDDVLQLIP